MFGAINFDTLAATLWDGMVAIFPLLLAVLIGLAGHAILIHILHRSGKFGWKKMSDYILPHIRSSLRWTLLLLAFSFAIGATGFPPDWRENFGLIVRTTLIAAIGWLAVGIVFGISDWIASRFAWENLEDNLAARRVSTQLRVFRNIAVFFVAVIAGTVIAMSIPGLRNLGVSLFASAGVAGLVIGMAARPTLSNVIAGMQLALAQPIRLDDVVIVEGEWGRVQEITATYVVVNIWDQRRLIVPLSYFIEKPFQNWTHTTSQLLGTAYLYLDHTVSVDAIRQELARILEQSKLWDKRVSAVQVTDVKESTVEVRVLVSARNSGDLFSLRCNVREALLKFLKESQQESLPRTRAELLKATG